MKERGRSDSFYDEIHRNKKRKEGKDRAGRRKSAHQGHIKRAGGGPLTWRLSGARPGREGGLNVQGLRRKH